jgi:phenylpropionate dioxygenase-like ring-hydroxylating dioxygenase large terminal subunit
MIRNQWYAILRSKEIPKKGIVSYKRLGEKLAFWRTDTKEIACIFDKCCHRGASISGGKVVNNHAQCPFHGFEYDKDGKVTTIPANGRNKEVPPRYRVNSYVVKEKYGYIWIYWGDKKEDLPEIPFFDDLKENFYYSEIVDHWPMHYSRCIENQMDVVHLPFVHHNTIGKGKKTIVYGPRIKWDDNKLTWFVKNVADDGVKVALPESEMGDDNNLFSLEFIMPSLWQNKISEKVRIFAAFAPIDEENTKIYLRFYQSFMPIWGLRGLIGLGGNLSSRIILNQDKRVVIKQIPKESSLRMGEKLIPGDIPIIEFRKKRDELKRENNQN